MINKKILNILRCPECKGHIEEKSMFLSCKNCNLAYPVLGNIPDMLMEDVWTINQAKKNGFMHSIKTK